MPISRPSCSRESKEESGKGKAERGDLGDGRGKGTEGGRAVGQGREGLQVCRIAMCCKVPREEPTLKCNRGNQGPLRLLDVFQLPIVLFCRGNPTRATHLLKLQNQLHFRSTFCSTIIYQLEQFRSEFTQPRERISLVDCTIENVTSVCRGSVFLTICCGDQRT